MRYSFFDTNYSADESGHFGRYGGRYVPEQLIPALDELTVCYKEARSDPKFLEEFSYYLKHYAGRPTPLVPAENLGKELGLRLYLKQEGLAHTGAHKINHCIGQILLAKRMGKNKIIAETGAGQHGLAVATVAAKFGMKCIIYMGARDIVRQRPNVFWMEKLGARVESVRDGGQTLKEAVNASIRAWMEDPKDIYYLLGSSLGPHPYPSMIADFQSVVGQEVGEQLRELTGKETPDAIFACVGGGSNSIGIFYPFIDTLKVELIGAEAGGFGKALGQNAARVSTHQPMGVSEGYKSLFIQDDYGNISKTHSISAGLDYAGIGPQHAHLAESERVKYMAVTDNEALSSWKKLIEKEGILSALESAHAAAAMEKMNRVYQSKTVIVNISGRGDKDLFILTRELRDAEFQDFLQDEIDKYPKNS